MARKSVLITGVNRGIGRALCERFAAAEWTVFGTLRRANDAPVVAAEDRVTIIESPLDTDIAIQAVADRISCPIDVLIHNAAGNGGGAHSMRNFATDVMLATMWINVAVPVALTQALRDRLRGLVIMMSTGNASLSLNTTPNMLTYKASKAALNQMMRTMAVDLREDGISVVALNPGWVRTDMGGQNAPLAPEDAAHRILAFANRSDHAELSGRFVNTNGSDVEW